MIAQKSVSIFRAISHLIDRIIVFLAELNLNIY